MSSDLTLKVILSLIDKMSDPARAALAGMEKHLESFGQKAQAIGQKFEAVGIRVGGVGLAMDQGLSRVGLGFSDVVGSAINTERALYALANTAGIAGAAATKMVDQWEVRIAELSTVTNQSKDQIVVAMQDLVSRGFDPEKALQMLTPVGKAATATGASISDMARSSFAAVDNLKIPVTELTAALDIMAKAGNEGAFELRDMAQYFPQLTSASRLLGMEGAKGMASLAAASQIAMKGAGDTATAANNLANFLAKLSSPETVGNFKDFGLNLAEETKKGLESGDLIGYMARRIRDVTGGDAQKVSELFRDMQAKNFIAPMIQNIEEYERIRDAALKGSQGVVDTQFDTAMQASAEKLKQMELNLHNAVDKSAVLDSFLDKLNGLAEWANAHPELAGWLGIAAVTTAGAGMLIGGASLAIGATVSAIGTIVPALSAVAGWLAANPVVLTLLGIGTAAVVGWKFGSFLNDQINLAMEALTGEKGATLGGKLYDWIEGPGGLIPTLKSLPGKLKATVAAWVQIGRDLINGLWEGIKAEIRKPIEAIKDMARELPDWAKKLLGIKSPSLVFKKIGENVGEGLALGIENSLPDVQAAADKMIEVVTVNPAAQPRNSDGSFKSFADAASQGTGMLGGFREYAASVQSMADQTKNMVVRSFKSMEDALTQFVRTGKWDFRSLTDSILSDLARMASSQFTSALSGLFGGNGGSTGGFGGIDGLISSALSWLFSANGNAFHQGKLLPFAAGGAFTNKVVSGATLFPLGMMGEAGPEAILPLARLGNGKLGVQSAGGGASVQVNIINNAQGAQATANERTDQNGNRIVDVLIEQVKGSIASDIGRGRGPIPGALASTYGLNRVAGAY